MKDFIMPFLQLSKLIPYLEDLSVLEIGCGVGGGLLPFIGCKRVVGVDTSDNKILDAGQCLGESVELCCNDIFKLKDIGMFDLIILKDTLEHIEDKQQLMDLIKTLLNAQGRAFVSFPSWRSPYGGHQQCCDSLARYMPYIHLFPERIYVAILRLIGESTSKISALLEIRGTRITAGGFEKLLDGYLVERYQPYIISPSYRARLGIRPMRLPSWLRFFRDSLTTTHYYLLKKADSQT